VLIYNPGLKIWHLSHFNVLNLINLKDGILNGLTWTQNFLFELNGHKFDKLKW
jgi:hypothetical protein